MMDSSVFVTNAALGCLFFLLTNKVGGFSIQIGYSQLSLTEQIEESPAFNVIFKVAFPVVLMCATAALFYSLHLDAMVANIWMSVAFGVMLRGVFTVAMGRSALVSWRRFFAYGAASIGLAYWLYVELVSVRAILMPNATTFGNELWLIIMLFVYDAINRASVNSDGREARRSSYILQRYIQYRSRFHSIVASTFDEPPEARFVYAIMIVESFNRPGLVRLLERLLGRFRRRGTYGLMQVESSRPLNDEESVKEGVAKLRDIAEKVQAASASHLEKITKDKDASAGYYAQLDEDGIARLVFERIAYLYNRSDAYVEDVMQIYDELAAIDHVPVAKVRPSDEDLYNLFAERER